MIISEKKKKKKKNVNRFNKRIISNSLNWRLAVSRHSILSLSYVTRGTKKIQHDLVGGLGGCLVTRLFLVFTLLFIKPGACAITS